MTERPINNGLSPTRDADIGPWLAKARELPPVRMDKVNRVRAALRRCGYENEQVLDATIERLCREAGFDRPGVGSSRRG